MAFEVKKATRSVEKLRLALGGPSGAGKSYSGHLLAKGMGIKKYCVIDTEGGSANLYADEFSFDHISFEPPYSPERYIEAISYAESLGYELIIIDSLSHEWMYANEVISRMTGNGIKNWGEYKSKRHAPLVEKILNSKSHIIVTTRSKTEYEEVEENGKKKYKKVGLAAKQEGDLEYEFTVVFDISRDHYYTCSKTRARSLESPDPQLLTEEVGKKLIEWLNKGEAAEETKKAPKTKDMTSVATKAAAAINTATAENIAAIRERLLELKSELSEEEYSKLDALHNIKLDSINKDF
jgi:hypothetical protein